MKLEDDSVRLLSDLRTEAVSCRINKLVTFAFKYLLLIAILPKAAQLVVFAVMSLYLMTALFKEAKFSVLTASLVTFICIYALSILLAVPTSSSDRLYATANTYLMWVIVLVIACCLCGHAYDINVERIGKYAFINLSVLALVMLVTQYSHTNMSLPWDGKTLWKDDWTNGVQTRRFTGFLGYSNAIVFYVLINGSVAFHYAKNKSLFYIVFAFIFGLLLIFSCGSRAGYIVGFLCLGFCALYAAQYQKRIKALIYTLIAALVVFGIIVFVVSGNSFQEAFDQLLSSRVNSNSTRMHLYMRSVQLTLEESPLIGMGIKEIETGASIPLGSHSTYIGTLYRTGLLGCLTFLVVICGAFRSVLRSHNIFTLIPFLCLLVFCVVEDIDGLNWVLFYTSLLIVLAPSGGKQNTFDFSRTIERVSAIEESGGLAVSASK